MFCNYDNNMMELKYISVNHSYKGLNKSYHNVPIYKCKCGFGKVLYSAYEFMNSNIDNNAQF